MFRDLANSTLAHALHALHWLPQVLETVHMTFHSLLVGAVTVLAARTLGAAPSVPIIPLARYALAACWLSLAMLAISGGLMFVMSADQYVANDFFLAKLATIAIAVALLAVWHRQMVRGDGTGRKPRTIAVLAVPLWFAALGFGRFVYTLL